MSRNPIYRSVIASIIAATACASQAQAQSADSLINKLVQKGVLTEKEGKDLLAEGSLTNRTTETSRWQINNAIKDITLYGDVRFRYEYRGTENVKATGDSQGDYARERLRYALRLGIKGNLYDDFYYGVRVETSSNPRSPWVTFGDDSTPTPSGKSSDLLYLGQAYLGWRAEDWFEMTVGRMANPLYVTPMLWDSDINPEGAVEKFKATTGKVNWFANLGQFIYQNTNPDAAFLSADTFILAWQLGAEASLAKDVQAKIAPVLYSYTGLGQKGAASYSSLSSPFVGQGTPTGLNDVNNASGGRYNQAGLNDLLILEVPAEVNFKVAGLNARVFGDFAVNFEGNERAEAAHAASLKSGTAIPGVFGNDSKAFLLGAGFGNLGLVYGQTSKKNTWEFRTYFQHVEQYAADVNLLDSDFFEGRANLQGIFTAFAYSFTDNVIGTARYGYAARINSHLGTGGNNLDMPLLNPINNYNLFQLDLTMRF